MGRDDPSSLVTPTVMNCGARGRHPRVRKLVKGRGERVVEMELTRISLFFSFFGMLCFDDGHVHHLFLAPPNLFYLSFLFLVLLLLHNIIAATSLAICFSRWWPLHRSSSPPVPSASPPITPTRHHHPASPLPFPSFAPLRLVSGPPLLS